MKRTINKGILCVILAVMGIIVSIAAFVFAYEEFYKDYGGLAIMIPAGIILPAVLSAFIGGICGTEIRRLWFLPLPLVFIMTFIFIPNMFLIFAAWSYLFTVICALIKHFDKKGKEKEASLSEEEKAAETAEEEKRKTAKEEEEKRRRDAGADSWPI